MYNTIVNIVYITVVKLLQQAKLVTMLLQCSCQFLHLFTPFEAALIPYMYLEASVGGV
jgi:hypothetical protein